MLPCRRLRRLLRLARNNEWSGILDRRLWLLLARLAALRAGGTWRSRFRRCHACGRARPAAEPFCGCCQPEVVIVERPVPVARPVWTPERVVSRPRVREPNPPRTAPGWEARSEPIARPGWLDAEVERRRWNVYTGYPALPPIRMPPRATSGRYPSLGPRSRLGRLPCPGVRRPP